MERNWYYAVGGVRQGPIAFEELRAMVRAGKLGALDLVWQPEFGPEWRKVGQVGALSEPQVPPVPPRAEPERRSVPLLGVTGAPPSALAAASQAFARVGEVLWKPFDISRWFSMGFCAWLAYLGSQSMYSFGDGNKQAAAISFKQQADLALDRLMAVLTQPHEATAAAVKVLLLLLFGLWVCSLRSRGDFMFLHRWYRPDEAIRLCWQSSRAAGHELFVWRLCFFLAALAAYALVGLAAYAQILRPYWEAGKVWDDAWVSSAVGCATSAVLIGLGTQVVGHLAKAFVVPIMYWHGVPAARAWLAVFALCNQYPFAVLGYLICGAVFWVVALCAVAALVLLTCCVGVIPLVLPYVGAVMLLPVFLFFRGYAICFLNQWRADLIPAKA
jgi:hypothetical protein